MSGDNPSIHRILVALDTSPSSLSALQNAVELAASLKAELIGLFVEDINMLRVTQLPFAREISFYSSSLRPLDLIEMERQLRAQAEQLRRIIASLADHRGVPWRLSVRRGSVAAEVLAAGAEADLVILGKIGRSFSGFRRTGSIVRNMIIRRTGLTLITQSGSRLFSPVIVLYDGSERGLRGLETACRMVRAEDGWLTVFIIAQDISNAREFQADVMDRLQLHGLGADFRLLIRPSLAGLTQLIRMESNGPVIVPCEQKPLEGEQLCVLVDELINPVLLIR